MNYQPILGDDANLQPCKTDQPQKPSSIKVKYPLFLVAAADPEKEQRQHVPEGAAGRRQGPAEQA